MAVTFAEALNKLVVEYLDCGADAESVCCDLYSMADALGHELIPDRLLPTAEDVRGILKTE